MNRKQKVAVVVGVVVIVLLVLLVLFPPWEADTSHATGSWLEDWSLQRGPAWIGNPPESPWDMMWAEESERLRAEGHDLESWVVLRDPAIPPVSINWSQLLMHTIAALALTVAAVVVLKERKGGA